MIRQMGLPSQLPPVARAVRPVRVGPPAQSVQVAQPVQAALLAQMIRTARSVQAAQPVQVARQIVTRKP